MSILDRFPDEDHVVGNEKLSVQVMQRPFAEHSLPGRNHKLLQQPKKIEFCHFDNNQSILVYKTREDINEKSPFNQDP